MVRRVWQQIRRHCVPHRRGRLARHEKQTRQVQEPSPPGSQVVNCVLDRQRCMRRIQVEPSCSGWSIHGVIFAETYGAL